MKIAAMFDIGRRHFQRGLAAAAIRMADQHDVADAVETAESHAPLQIGVGMRLGRDHTADRPVLKRDAGTVIQRLRGLEAAVYAADKKALWPVRLRHGFRFFGRKTRASFREGVVASFPSQPGRRSSGIRVCCQSSLRL
jgi:hypothetical protein